MSGRAFQLAMTVVAPCGAGTCEAAQHSQSLEAWFLNAPGFKVVMPATVHDCKGLLKTAIRDNNPVIYLWHKALYDLEEEVPAGEWMIPLGQAAVRREGQDVTVVACSLMMHRALEAAQCLRSEISGRVILNLERKVEYTGFHERTFNNPDMATLWHRNGGTGIIGLDRSRRI